MTDPDTGDFTLGSGSPCEDAALPFGDPYNVGLLPSSSWPSGILTDDRNGY